MPIGGEPFDLEALYFDDFGGYAYFAIVTSLGSSGVSGYYMNALALDLDNDPEWGDQGYEYGIKLRGADAGKVCYLPVWTAAFADRDPEADFTCDGSDSVWTGTADLVYTLFKAGADNSHNTYVVEIEANKGLLGTPQFQDISDWHITQTCGNDILELNGFDWDYLPEFTTVGAALALLGAAGYVAYRKKKN
ncbi:LPXTG cell wall anchor domain-containing protein [Candidatus Woesearchaeota archaeon]|nr:LPXTG cell wall anchor domain-containing protein [Candidatus Woesearchaeota archaeon]